MPDEATAVPPEVVAAANEAIDAVFQERTKRALKSPPEKFTVTDAKNITVGVLRRHWPTLPVAPAKAVPADSSPFGDKKVIPPQPEWVTAYSASIGWPLDGEAFCDFYERKGWIVGRTKMKNWQAACRYAKREQFAFGGPKTQAKPGVDYSKW